MDITHRGDFDRAVQARFPKARRHRKENNDGWEDTFRVGFLEVAIRVCDTKKPTPSRFDVGSLVVEVRGIRKSIDGSSTPLWFATAVGWEEGNRVLDTLREELLGLTQALGFACGRKKGEVVPAKDPEDDVDALMDLIDL